MYLCVYLFIYCLFFTVSSVTKMYLAIKMYAIEKLNKQHGSKFTQVTYELGCLNIGTKALSIYYFLNRRTSFISSSYNLKI